MQETLNEYERELKAAFQSDVEVGAIIIDTNTSFTPLKTTNVMCRG
jgi:hypothetical protein